MGRCQSAVVLLLVIVVHRVLAAPTELLGEVHSICEFEHYSWTGPGLRTGWVPLGGGSPSAPLQAYLLLLTLLLLTLPSLQTLLTHSSPSKPFHQSHTHTHTLLAWPSSLFSKPARCIPV